MLPTSASPIFHSNSGTLARNSRNSNKSKPGPWIDMKKPSPISHFLRFRRKWRRTLQNLHSPYIIYIPPKIYAIKLSSSLKLSRASDHKEWGMAIKCANNNGDWISSINLAINIINKLKICSI